jgi:Domain of unknown function (DUF1906)
MRWFGAVVFLILIGGWSLSRYPGERPASEGGPYKATLVHSSGLAASSTFIGFDRNDYPGDEALPALRQTFAFAGYWLGPPPGEKNNSWTGKRGALDAQGFGFLLLYRGKTSSEISTNKIANEVGLADAREAVAAARREGFPEGSVIFLDEEEGGRYFPTQHLYLHTWAEELQKLHFHPGIYCSGIVVDEGEGSKVITSDDIRQHVGIPDVVFWVYNDACPPSPGCAVLKNPPAPSTSGVPYAAVWQFVRSPREKKVARHCVGYASDGNCYAPGDAKHQWIFDMNVAATANPSAPR